MTTVRQETAIDRWMVGGRVLIVLVLLLTSYARNRVWTSEIEFWTDAVAKSPRKAKSRINLGVAYEATDLDKALEQFLIAVEIDPRNSSSYSNICGIYNKKGVPEKALTYCTVALMLDARSLDAKFNTGISLWTLGHTDRAREQFEQILKARPDDAEVRRILESLMERAGKAGVP